MGAEGAREDRAAGAERRRGRGRQIDDGIEGATKSGIGDKYTPPPTENGRLDTEDDEAGETRPTNRRAVMGRNRHGATRCTESRW